MTGASRTGYIWSFARSSANADETLTGPEAPPPMNMCDASPCMRASRDWLTGSHRGTVPGIGGRHVERPVHAARGRHARGAGRAVRVLRASAPGARGLRASNRRGAVRAPLSSCCRHADPRRAILPTAARARRASDEHFWQFTFDWHSHETSKKFRGRTRRTNPSACTLALATRHHSWPVCWAPQAVHAPATGLAVLLIRRTRVGDVEALRPHS